MYWRDQRNQAFKDCGGVIRLVVNAVINCVHSMYVVSLWANIGIFGTRKTYENCLLSSFFARKDSEDINEDLNILARFAILRHEWYSIKIPVEGAVRLLLLIYLNDETCTAAHIKFLPLYPGASVSQPFTVIEIPGGFL